MNKNTRLLACTALLASLAIPAGFAAEAPAKAAIAPITLAKETTKQNTAAGRQYGSFVVKSKLDATTQSTDNLYATESNRDSDTSLRLSPTVTAASKWNKHALNSFATAEMERNLDNTDDDAQTYAFGADGRYDISRTNKLRAYGNYRKTAEDRGQPESFNSSAKPTLIHTAVAGGSWNMRMGQTETRLSTQVKDIDFENGYTSNGSLRNNNLRDRVESEGTVQVLQTLAPRQTAYVKLTTDHRNYDASESVARNNSGLATAIGFSSNWTPTLYSDVYVGTLNRDYSGNLEDVSNLNYGGSLIWDATQATQLSLNLDRSIEETTLSNSSGFLQTSFTVGGQHKLTDRMLLEAYGIFRSADYNSNTAAAARDDEYYTAQLGGTYFVSQNLNLKGQYLHTTRNSNATGGDYARNTVTLTAGLTF